MLNQKESEDLHLHVKTDHFKRAPTALTPYYHDISSSMVIPGPGLGTAVDIYIIDCHIFRRGDPKGAQDPCVYTLNAKMLKDG